MKERQCNFELLRILAMVGIYCGHIIGHFELVETATGINYWFYLIFGNFSRIGVNLFIFISCYFLSQSTFKSKHAAKTWFTAWFYGVLVLLLTAIFMGPHSISMGTILNSISPVVVAPLWFISVYFTFLFVYPAFQKILDYRNICKVLLFVGFILICVQSTVLEPISDNRFTALAWFCYVFLLIGYYRRYLSDAPINKYLALLFALLIYGVCIYLMGKGSPESTIYEKCVYFLTEYKSIPNLLISLGLFIFFSKIHVPYNKVITFVSASTLAIYCIHANAFGMSFLRHYVMNYDVWTTKPYAIALFSILVIIIFLTVACMEYIRKRLLEEHFLNLKPIAMLCERIDKFYNE